MSRKSKDGYPFPVLMGAGPIDSEIDVDCPDIDLKLLALHATDIANQIGQAYGDPATYQDLLGRFSLADPLINYPDSVNSERQGTA